MRVMRDGVLAAIAGFIASLVMDVATTAFQASQSAADRARERAVSPGLAYEVAAVKAGGAIGIDLSDRARRIAGSAFHFALGIGWAPLYPLLRRWLRLSAIAAGLGTGLSLFVIVDEGLNPVIGSSAPPRAYPLSTHMRGFVGHLVYGAVLALAVELAWRLIGDAPKGSDGLDRARGVLGKIGPHG